MYKIIIAAVLLISLSACTEWHETFGGIRPSEMTMKPPPGPPLYQQGFNDGCESGFSGYANSFNKMFWKWKQDPELAQNKEYYQIWKDAYSYCAIWGMMGEEHDYGNWR